MARILIKDPVKTFGAYNAVSGVNMDSRDGEFRDIVAGLQAFCFDLECPQRGTAAPT